MHFLPVITAVLLSTLSLASPNSSNQGIDEENTLLETRATTKKCVESQRDIFNADIRYGIPFCHFWHAIPRTRTPVPGLSVQQVYNVCDCILEGVFEPAAKVGDRITDDFRIVTVTKIVTETILEPKTFVTIGRTRTVSEKQPAKTTVTVAKTTITAHGSTHTIAKTTILAAKSTATSTRTVHATVTVARTEKSTVTSVSTHTVHATVTVGKTRMTTVTSFSIRTVRATVTAAKSTITAPGPTHTIAETTITAAKRVVTSLSTRTVHATVTVAKVEKSTVTSVSTHTVRTTVTSKATGSPVSTSIRTVYITSISTVAADVPSSRSSSGSKTISSSPDEVSISKAIPSSKSSTGQTTSIASSSRTTPSSSSSSSSTCPLSPTAAPPTSVTISDTQYDQFYTGCGYTENSDNPGNAFYSDNFPPVTVTYDSSYTASEAVQQCASDAFNRYQDPNEYLSFDLHFISTSGAGYAGEGGAGYWECVQYFSEQSDADDASYYNVPNSNVTVAYGYSSGLYSDAAAAAAAAAASSSSAAAAAASSTSTSGDSQKVKRMKSSGWAPEGRGKKPIRT